MKNAKIATIIAVASILAIAATSLTPTLQQLYAFSQRHPLEKDIIQSAKVTSDERSQHMDQENICFRSNSCRQSSVGQETLGNDNSVTGFADQSYGGAVGAP
jgi:hypothetical protein